jgi:hypothetical protein
VAIPSQTACVKRAWNYTTQSGRSFAPVPLVAGVAIPFEDLRPPTTSDENTVALGLLPLVPWGTSLRHRPEDGPGSTKGIISTIDLGEVTQREKEIGDALRTIRDREERGRLEAELRQLQAARSQGTLQMSGEDLPSAAAVSLLLELRASGLFKAVIPVRDRRDAAQCDVVFNGRLLATEQRTGILWYGLSLAGPALWGIGFPSQTFHVRTAYEVTLLDYEGRPMDVFRYHEVAPTGIAWAWGKHYYRLLPTLWAGMNRRLVQDARESFESFPTSYWNSFANEAAMKQRR